MTQDGIELNDGTRHKLDVVICATGYDTTYQLPFPIVGLNGTHLNTKWFPHPRTYLSVCVDEFPNFFLALGPNSGVGSGSLLVLIEKQVEYAVRTVKKMQRERLKSVVVKREAVDDYDEYIEVSEPILGIYIWTLLEIISSALFPNSKLAHALR